MKYFLICLLFLSCSTPKVNLTDDGRKVKVFPNKPFPSCEVKGPLVGENDFGSVETAKNHARNLAAEMDGNYLLIKDELKNGKDVKVEALAYFCK